MDLSWKLPLQDEFTKPYWKKLTDILRHQYLETTVYPHPKQVFRALDLVPFDKVKVVIIGQDPYFNPNQANGMAFSVKDGVPLPPSLRNIYKEINNDLGITCLESGDLTRWAEQGVLLLNSVLTVMAYQPASHTGLGWEQFSDSIIRLLNEQSKDIVYMLWGRYAQMKGAMINTRQNLVLMSGHPSPYSSNLFFNRHHFSRCNKYLEEHEKAPIDWH